MSGGTGSGVGAVAPAKINLALRVGARRDDGFHPLNTLFHAVDLLERVTVRPSAGPADAVEVRGRDARAVPLDRSNLVLRAAELLRDRAARREFSPVEFLIDKAIPVAGGLAGGSADGAAALVALNELWGLGLSRERLIALAGELGSDVPFALHGGTAVGHGRGELLSPVAAGGTLHWVLLTDPRGVSTPEAFQMFDELRAGAGPASPPPIPGELLDAVRSGDPWAVGAGLVNDLEPAVFAFRPELEELVARARLAGACGAVVSGSGPTVACLAPDSAAADVLADELRSVHTAGDVLRASGPAAGAAGA
ncbi:MAG: 4-(cytidine 5'-diphospho)-2-C-methyl-D-erythritol kinase [Bifidobacteriaceae bacterium]|nr:4-(cytidine 5'-diphospho)-2-C-methyl-D-erythritol kinase [Bifidobacteriaceae bacterium]